MEKKHIKCFFERLKNTKSVLCNELLLTSLVCSPRYFLRRKKTAVPSELDFVFVVFMCVKQCSEI